MKEFTSDQCRLIYEVAERIRYEIMTNEGAFDLENQGFTEAQKEQYTADFQREMNALKQTYDVLLLGAEKNPETLKKLQYVYRGIYSPLEIYQESLQKASKFLQENYPNEFRIHLQFLKECLSNQELYDNNGVRVSVDDSVRYTFDTPPSPYNDFCGGLEIMMGILKFDGVFFYIEDSKGFRERIEDLGYLEKIEVKVS